MNATPDLHTQLAQRLFGWRWEASAQLWRDPDGVYRDAKAFRIRLPAYSSDPAATALVWQWLEELKRVRAIYVGYGRTRKKDIDCDIVYGGTKPTDRWDCARGHGPTWQEALCRAALALAEALDKEEP